MVSTENDFFFFLLEKIIDAIRTTNDTNIVSRESVQAARSSGVAVDGAVADCCALP